MAERERVSVRWSSAHVAALGVVLLAAALAAPRPAAAYVVVTSDNRVYDVATRPEVRNDLVLFALDGKPVSLRVYDVNITKTNELNQLLDQGAGAPSLTAQLRALKPAVPTDERMIVSSRLHQVMGERGEPKFQLVHVPGGEAAAYEEGNARARRTKHEQAEDEKPSRFSKEAREAMDDAQREVRHPAEPPAPAAARSDEEPRGERHPGGRRHREERAADSGKSADVDGQIAAEQEHLRKLTSGEEVSADLEGDIDRSMDRIKRMQKRRGRTGSAPASDEGAAPAAPAPAETAGEEAAEDRGGGRIEGELARARARLARLKSQQAQLPAGPSNEREMVDEMVGETQYKIDKLERKLGRSK